MSKDTKKKAFIPTIALILVVIVVVALFFNKPTQDTNVDADNDNVAQKEKSSEQLRYEKECIAANRYIQEDPDLDYKLEDNTIISYCGCLGDSFFPGRSEKIIFPPEDDEDDSKKEYFLEKRCKASFSDADKNYGYLSDNTGDKEFILESVKWSIYRAEEGFWHEHDKYSISLDRQCVLNSIYDENKPPYYVETLYFENIIQPRIRACSNDPYIETFIQEWFE